MKNKIPFCLEDAKNGRKCYINQYIDREIDTIQRVFFIGTKQNGNVVCETEFGSVLTYDSIFIFHIEE
jgi:hypothetical protein